MNKIEMCRKCGKNPARPRVRNGSVIWIQCTECNNKWARNRYRSGWPKQNDFKVVERKKLYHAVRDGKVIKSTHCQLCLKATPSHQLHGHHKDYNKWDEVTWLCIGCHSLTSQFE